jgi:hypothetical protein
LRLFRQSLAPRNKPPAEAGSKIVADESNDLLPFTDLQQDIVAGNWRRDERGILHANTEYSFVKGYSEAHARIQFPVRPHGDFEITCRYVINNEYDSSVVFPAGSHSARAILGFWEEGDRLVSDSGSRTHGIKNAVVNLGGDKKLYEARIVVRTSGDTSAIQIYVDGTLTCDWRRENAALANNEPC